MSGPDTSNETVIRERARREVIARSLGFVFAGFGFGCFIIAAVMPSFAAGAIVFLVIAIYCFCQASTLKSGPSK